MRRALVRGIEGTLSADLATGATTMSAAVLGSLPALTGLTYIPIIIDPLGIGAGTEVVYLELHTASATTGTIRRGREATADPGVSHAAGIPIMVAMTEHDAEPDSLLDRPWGGDDSGNVEFNRIDEPTSLPTGFAWVNQGSATFVERSSYAVVTAPASASASLRCIVKSLPSGWGTTLTELVGKCFGMSPAINFWGAGLMMRESSSGKILQFSMGGGLSVSQGTVNLWTNATTFNTTIINQTFMFAVPHWRVKRNSATNWDFWCSVDGRYWFPLQLAYNLNAFMAPDQFGIFANSQNSIETGAACDWIRFR